MAISVRVEDKTILVSSCKEAYRRFDYERLEEDLLQELCWEAFRDRDDLYSATNSIAALYRALPVWCFDN